MNRILIIGGGASGMAAAISAAQANPSAQITILDGLDHIGKKILATGNGRCNLTNAQISPGHYHTQNTARLNDLLADMPAERPLAFFRELGLYCTEEDRGRIYPYSRQASMVLDVLKLALQRHHIQVQHNCKVKSLSVQKKVFTAQTESGQSFHADAVILAAGGRAAPKQGTNGTSYPLALQMGHRYARLYPCLVPLRCGQQTNILKQLKGIRVICRATLFDGKQKLTEELGEVQLTDYGLSGIPALQLSCWMNKPIQEQAYTVRLDLFPDWQHNELRSILQQRIKQYPTDKIEDNLLGLINKKLLFAALETLHLTPIDRPSSSLKRQDIDALVSLLKGWDFPITGIQTWDHAQVTGGGVFLNEIDNRFRSVKQPGLFLAGEVLDIAGDCGGYNLHWAWCSGITAGEAAAEYIAHE